MAASQKITPVPGGVVITSREPVYEVRAYATVYVTLTQDTTFDRNWAHVLSRASTMMDHRIQLGENFKTLVKARVAGLKRHLKRITRVKRGLFNFVGDIGSALFGIPSASDIDALKKVNQQLADDLQGVVTTQGQVIGRVNLIGEKQKQIAEVINQLSEQQKKNEVDIWLLHQGLHGLQHKMDFNTDALRLSFQLDIVEESLDDYKDMLSAMQAVRIACEAQIVTEQVLPVSIVNELLSSGENHQHLPAVQYYSYIKVDKIIEIEGQQFCVLKAPMLADTSPVRIGIHTFPVCQEDRCIRLYQPQPFIIDFATEELYFPEQCFGPTPQVCQAGVRYDKNQQLCLHGLINDDSQQQLTCPLTYYDKQPPAQKIVADKLNRFVLSTTHTLYHYRCPQHRPVTGELPSGSYVIDVEPHCIFDATQWMLQGVSILETNYTQKYPPPLPINVTWFNLPKHNDTFSISLPTGIDKIEVPSYEELQKLPVADISKGIQNMQNDIGKAPLAWWMYVIIALAALTGLILVTHYIHKCFCPNRHLWPKNHQNDSIVHYDPNTQKINIEAQTDDEGIITNDV